MIWLLIDKNPHSKALTSPFISNIGNIRPEFAHPDFDPGQRLHGAEEHWFGRLYL
jgi:hypothetical protein